MRQKLEGIFIKLLNLEQDLYHENVGFQSHIFFRMSISKLGLYEKLQIFHRN